MRRARGGTMGSPTVKPLLRGCAGGGEPGDDHTSQPRQWDARRRRPRRQARRHVPLADRLGPAVRRHGCSRAFPPGSGSTVCGRACRPTVVRPGAAGRPSSWRVSPRPRRGVDAGRRRLSQPARVSHDDAAQAGSLERAPAIRQPMATPTLAHAQALPALRDRRRSDRQWREKLRPLLHPLTSAGS